MSSIRSIERVALLVLLACCACKSAASGPSSSTGAQNSKSSARKADAGTKTGMGAAQASMMMDAGASNAHVSDAGGSAPAQDGHVAMVDAAQHDAGQQSGTPHDAGHAPADAGHPASDAAIMLPDAASLGMGSCCEVHDTPGCSNADLEVCVCEKLSTCCTDAWNAGCVLIVQQRYCQPGVRDCVCMPPDAGWGQKTCCEMDWTDTFCDTVAESKCHAIRGCF